MADTVAHRPRSHNIRCICRRRPAIGTLAHLPANARTSSAENRPLAGKSRVISATMSATAGIPPYEHVSDSDIAPLLRANLGGWPMLSNKTSAPLAHIKDMNTSDFIHSSSDLAGEEAARDQSRVFSAFDEFLDRMPAWIFHSLGGITALAALWFALAFLGGLPGGIVEWITLAMMGGFAYAVGFMIPLVLTYLVEQRSRLLMALLVVGGGAVYGAMTLPLPL